MKEHLNHIRKEQWFVAIIRNDINKLIELIEKGVDINLQDGTLKTALHHSSINTERIEITKFLLKQPGIDVNIQDCFNDTALIRASFMGCKEIVKLILHHSDIDVNLHDNDGETALINSTYPSNKEILKMLLEHPDIDITIKGNNGKTFMDYLNNNSFLKDYSLQKKILENNRDDILLFLDKNKLLIEEIKKEAPDLFEAKNWGLV
jgi:ankyrin repeat protein